MASELNMYESQVAEHKMDIDRLQRELQEVKKKYYLQKKKDHQQRFPSIYLNFITTLTLVLYFRERDRAIAQGMGPPILPNVKGDMPRFTGGGFNLKQTQKVTA